MGSRAEIGGGKSGVGPARPPTGVRTHPIAGRSGLSGGDGGGGQLCLGQPPDVGASGAGSICRRAGGACERLRFAHGLRHRPQHGQAGTTRGGGQERAGVRASQGGDAGVWPWQPCAPARLRRLRPAGAGPGQYGHGQLCVGGHGGFHAPDLWLDLPRRRPTDEPHGRRRSW